MLLKAMSGAYEGGEFVQKVPVVGHSAGTEALGSFGQSEIDSADGLSRLFLVLAIGTLYLVSMGG